MRFTAAIGLMLFVLSCSDDDMKKLPRVEWKKLGLDGKTVNEIKISNGGLYVATTTGLYKVQAGSVDGDFEPIGFANQNVEALELLDNGQLIVSVYDKSGETPPALFRSDDDGQNWIEINSNFGGTTTETVFDLEVHPDGHLLYATGYSVVARSADAGVTWQPIFGDWGGFATGLSVVEVNPADEGLWAGGQGAIENGFLLHSTDGGTTWERWDDLVENPTVVKEITFSEEDADEIFTGFEGALLKTEDGGSNWKTLIHSEETRFFFGISIGEHNPERVYAGGWVKTPDPQPLLLFISDDGGTSWQEVRYNPEDYGGILEMHRKEEDGNDVLILGLDKGGVYEVTISD